MKKYRTYIERLKDFCKLHNYTLIADEGDYVVLEKTDGYRFSCGCEALHYAMLENGIE